MRCPGCGQENPGTARFCGACGHGLESTCPACRASNPPANRFCHQCGASLAPAAPASTAPFASPHTCTPKHLAEKILTARA